MCISIAVPFLIFERHTWLGSHIFRNFFLTVTTCKPMQTLNRPHVLAHLQIRYMLPFFLWFYFIMETNKSIVSGSFVKTEYTSFAAAPSDSTWLSYLVYNFIISPTSTLISGQPSSCLYCFYPQLSWGDEECRKLDFLFVREKMNVAVLKLVFGHCCPADGLLIHKCSSYNSLSWIVVQYGNPLFDTLLKVPIVLVSSCRSP